MNDIADTSVCIQTSAQFVSLRREQESRSFFRVLMLCSSKNRARHAEPSREKNAQSFVFMHEHEFHRGDLAV
jgi:hypothetical protein